MKQITLKTLAIICDAKNQRSKKQIFSQKYLDLYNYEHIVIMENGELFDIDKNRFINQTMDEFGYLSVTIDGNKFYVHRLMAIAFIPWDGKSNLVCHKNKIRNDNRAINIMWSNNNFINIRRNGFDRPNLGKSVVAYDMDGNYVATYKNGGQASKKLGLNRSEVYRCCKGIRKSTGGYRFEYK